ncbi:MAG: amidohydrolase family protein [Verrucomicrobia bacterium]|nr:amidohydrolase family protein [Verrucomicrobiota bacterium]
MTAIANLWLQIVFRPAHNFRHAPSRPPFLAPRVRPRRRASSRRRGLGCASLGLQSAGAIDTHTHFYDPKRPQGVPWPPKNDAILYRPVYPTEFVQLGKPLGITETVVVEASPWLEDNQWVLDLAKDHPCIRGVVGNIKPGTDDFASHLKRFAKHPLFRGIRVGVWEPSLLTSATVLRDLRRLADHNLSLDVLTGPDKLPDVALLAGTIPTLRIVVDHCANVRVDGNAPPGRMARRFAGLRAASESLHESFRAR